MGGERSKRQRITWCSSSDTKCSANEILGEYIVWQETTEITWTTLVDGRQAVNQVIRHSVKWRSIQPVGGRLFFLFSFFLSFILSLVVWDCVKITWCETMFNHMVGDYVQSHGGRLCSITWRDTMFNHVMGDYVRQRIVWGVQRTEDVSHVDRLAASLHQNLCTLLVTCHTQNTQRSQPQLR